MNGYPLENGRSEVQYASAGQKNELKPDANEQYTINQTKEVNTKPGMSGAALRPYISRGGNSLNYIVGIHLGC